MKRFFVTDADGYVLRQGTCPDADLENQLGGDGVLLYSSNAIEEVFVEDDLYKINPESGGFEPRPDAPEPSGGFTPPGGMYDEVIV